MNVHFPIYASVTKRPRAARVQALLYSASMLRLPSALKTAFRFDPWQSPCQSPRLATKSRKLRWVLLKKKQTQNRFRGSLHLPVLGGE